MRIRMFVLIAALYCAPLMAAEAQLSPRYRTVYILEMSNGLDQYLASRLTSSRVLWVVLEPANADAVFTEALDDSFWNWLGRNYPPAPPVAGSSGSRGTASRSGSRRTGMVFLVDPRSRVVLWSTYQQPRMSSSSELNQTADRISNQLKLSFGKK